MRGYYRNTQFFGRGRGLGLGLGGGNPYPFCRFNPSLPSRRAMAFGIGEVNEAEILKKSAEYLQSELDTINKRLKDLEVKS